MERVNLNLTQLAVQYKINVGLRYHSRPDGMVREAFDCMIHELVARVASEDQEPIVIRVPATWWDHLKETFSYWLDKRGICKWWKIKRNWTEHRIDVKTLYPRLKTKLDFDQIGEQFTILCRYKNKDFFSGCLTDTPETPLEFKRRTTAEPFAELDKDGIRCRSCGRILVKY